ncbi:MAG: hypothetical protein JWN84_2893 [Nocardioides sp.]|nr:hypothetical protein [Nocardioides sp.]
MTAQLIDGLWRLPAASLTSPALEADPFTDESALDEAQLLDVRFDAVNGLVGILLEMRMAILFSEGEAALVVARSVSSLSVSADLVGHRIVRGVGATVTEVRRPRVQVALHLGTRGTVAVEAGSLSCYLLAVPGLPEAPPDYVSGDEAEVQAGLPQWHSSCTVLQASHLDAAVP